MYDRRLVVRRKPLADPETLKGVGETVYQSRRHLLQIVFFCYLRWCAAVLAEHVNFWDNEVIF